MTFSMSLRRGMQAIVLKSCIWVALQFPIAGASMAQSYQWGGPSEKATQLVVLFHAFHADASSLDALSAMVGKGNQALGAGPPDVLRLELPFGMLSAAKPEEVVDAARRTIGEAWKAKAARGTPYEKVTLMGHSMGALYARKVYLAEYGDAAGSTAPASDGRWLSHVDRLVLLAGMNRGWTISHHLDLWRGLAMTAGTWYGHLQAAVGLTPIVFSARRGSPFITEMRLQWLAMRRAFEPGREGAAKACGQPVRVGAPCVIQLLGTVDDLVPPEDNIDRVTGDNFIYVDVPHSGHRDVIDVVDASHPGRGEVRAALIAKALWATDFASDAVVLQRRALEVEPKVEHVVFVMHGIRDDGYWTEKIARRIVRISATPTLVTDTSSYGYFPILSFLRPGARREKVEWLMDRYTELKALYPNAQFSYVGHSNGTYLLKSALEEYPQVRFRNVVFAGSVVRTDFDWSRFVPDRVQSLKNFTASADWVVAWLPKAFQQVGFQDIGSAGHDGFRLGQFNAERAIGSHSAALSEEWWDSIAHFIVEGRYKPPEGELTASESTGWVRIPSYVAWALWVAAAFLLYRILRFILALRVREWLKTLLVVGYVFGLWSFVTLY